ncbi:hypothetical protein ACF0H5_019513 [Mactra antiquata]
MASRLLVVAIVTFIIILGISSVTKGQPGRSRLWDERRCSHFLEFLGYDSNFEVERIPQMRNFVGPYSYDVGTCPLGTCKTKIFKGYFHGLNDKCSDDGYIANLTETRTADLGDFGTSEYEYVVKCICEKDTGIPINVTIVDSEDNTLIEENIYVLFNGNYVGYTDNGEFKNKIASSTSTLVVRAVGEDNGMYLEAVKIIDIPDNFRGPIVIRLLMIQKAEPVEIDSTIPNTLYLSDSALTQEEEVAFIEIEADSFELVIPRQHGPPRTQRYDGQVMASVTFIDSNTVDEAMLPGRFQTLEGDRAEYLISDGIVSFEFTDGNGQELRLRNEVVFTVKNDMRLWSLNPNTGSWEPMGESVNRTKRQLTVGFLVSIENRQWINVDRLLNAPPCYFKSRIFDGITGNEIPSSMTASFRPEIVAYNTMNQRLRLFPASTNTPSDTCYQVYCPNKLEGFISMSSMEIVSIGGVPIPYSSYLIPKSVDDYIPSIEILHDNVHYATYPFPPSIPDEVYVVFESNPDGPFYPSITDCENSAINEASFHFYKPPLPSYERIPDNTELCTGRILFRDGREFNSSYFFLNSLPNITAISVWDNEDDTDMYYYTDTTQMVNSINEEFVYACVTYRCSESSNPTLVYLDIDIPHVTHFYNVTLQNGSVVEYNYTVSDFQCYGECLGPLCQQNPDIVNTTNGTSMEGSFFPIENIGPIFDNTECRNVESLEEHFDYSFTCYSNQNSDGAQRRLLGSLQRRKLFK